ncbi:MAG: AraC family transcriptional regulator [Clostridiaceae bacterium]|nr:AraC family transcriptional regulator [Clostridiaceae bacterium]
MIPSNLKKLLKHTVLIRNVCILSLLLFIPFITLIHATIRISSKDLMSYTKETEYQLLNSQKMDMEANLTIIDNIANQLLFDNDILLFTQIDPFNPDYEKIKVILQKIERTLYSLKMIDSIYLFDNVHPYVLSDVMVYKDKFSDPLVLYDDSYQTPGLKKLRVLDRSTPYTKTAPVTIMSYVRKLRGFMGDEDITLVINLNAGVFLNSMLSVSQNSTFLVTGEEKQPLVAVHNSAFTDLKTLDEIYQTDVHSLIESSVTDQSIDDRNYVSSIGSDTFRLSFINIQQNDFYIKSVINTTKKLVIPYVLITASSMILILLASFYLYRPLKNLLKSLEGFTSEEAATVNNEYSRIDHLVKNLHTQNQRLKQKYDSSYPYVEAYALHEFLVTPNFNKDSFYSALTMLGMEVRHQNFLLLLIKFNEEHNSKMPGHYLAPFLQRPEDLSFCYTITDSRGLAVLINTDIPRDALLQLLDEIAQSLIEPSASAVLGLSEAFCEIDLLPIYYNDSLNKITKKTFHSPHTAEVFDLTLDCPAPIPDETALPLESLIHHVKLQNMELALKEADQLFHTSVNLPEYSESHMKYLVFQMERAIYKQVLLLGGIYDDGNMSEYQLFSSIGRADHSEDLHCQLTSFIESSIDSLSSLVQRHYHEIILQTHAFIESHYMEDISLRDISEHVHLSQNYLCNIFKAECGETIMNMLTRIRMAAACELLSDEKLLVKEVAAKVGYNNVQSFIRFFKKAYGMPPDQYRTSLRSGSL